MISKKIWIDMWIARVSDRLLCVILRYENTYGYDTYISNLAKEVLEDSELQLFAINNKNIKTKSHNNKYVTAYDAKDTILCCKLLCH